MSCRTTFIIGYLITYLLYTGFAAGVTSLLAVQGRGLHLSLDDVVKMKLTLVATAHTTQHPFIKVRCLENCETVSQPFHNEQILAANLTGA